ncbi:Methyltransferase-like protein 7B [Mycena venus]|uniref:Methyltransferase-like protein 7B n=1 Tax=Mycena venus TaxID=2733690 RepID=A0A8H6YLY5_9AGAR|nr:Methyltransferase-like protein 7B [Mycena venus]
MKFRAILDMIITMQVALFISIPAAFRAILASPSLLFKPEALARICMANIWIPFGAGGDERSRADKKKLITPHARGVVLDLGAGHGHTVNYLDRTAVTKYVALEPNTLMHSRIREMATAAGFTESDGTLLILSCGAEDTASALSAVQAPVDTIVSVLTLCTVPSPQKTLRALVLDVLAPGGALLFHEHIRRDRADAAWWQEILTPMWKRVFDGCCLDRPTDVWVKELTDDSGATVWSEGVIWDPNEGKDIDQDDLFWLQVGRFVKKVTPQRMKMQFSFMYFVHPLWQFLWSYMVYACVNGRVYD